MEEIMVPLTAEDFEIGDRVYRLDSKYGTTMFAQVTDIEGQGIHLISEDGVPYVIHENRFGMDPHKYFTWGKMLDVDKLEEGVRLSVVEHRERRYVTVERFRRPRYGKPGYLEMAWEDGSVPNYSLELKTEEDLDKALIYWELEE